MKIVVVGGVAGGASAAARCRRLSEEAEIVILERDRYVSFANCGLPYHIGGTISERESLLLQTPESLRASLNLDVRIGHAVKAIHRDAKSVSVHVVATEEEYEEAYDKLVLCPGASPLRPGLPGVNGHRVFVLRNIPDMDAIKAVVDGGAASGVVIGGGYIGVEMAEALRQRGLRVSLIEVVDQIMPPLDPEMARDLQYHMEAHGVDLHLGTAATGFEERGSGIQTRLSDDTVLDSDFVVLAAGVNPENELAKTAGLDIGSHGGIRTNAHMQTSDPDIYAAGDSVEVVDTITGENALIPLAGPANRQGRIAAENIFGRDTEYTSTQGTAIVKVFDMTGGGTGASEKALRRIGIPFRKVYIHPSGHAGYYPGTNPMHFKLLFDPGDGRVLGAQVVGFDGVDKRLDVIATAVRAGMTVYDLEELELAYAPPYGSAKDPVNMAGFVASNLLRGDVRFWYAEDYPEITVDAILVDVRSPKEHGEWSIPGAINIPLTELRGRLDELDRTHPILLFCRVGFRSYLAYRLLHQSGFQDLATLAGGSRTFTSYHRNITATGKPGIPFVAHAEEKMAEADGDVGG